MNAPLQPPLPRPVLLDEVDQFLEFVDSGAGDLPPIVGGRPGKVAPVFTEVVDRLLDFTDGPNGTPHPEGTAGRRPLLVDHADQFVEFADGPPRPDPEGTTALPFPLTTRQEEDGRWRAEVPALPGVLTYGQTRREAIEKAQVLSLRVLADRLEHGETVPLTTRLFSVAP